MRLFTLLSILLTFFTSQAHAQAIKVTATTGMVADLVSHIGKDRVTVTTLMGPGVDPHTYKPTTRDIKLLYSAEVIFYNGLLLEGKMATILEKYSNKKPCVAIGESLPKSELLAPPEFLGHPDPHIWMNVALWSKTADIIAKTLSEKKPEDTAFFQNNLKTVQNELLELHNKITKTLATIGKSQRVLITAHDAFGYFGKAYDIEVHGIQGISTESEAGLNDINRLVDFIVEKQIKAVFVETSVSERNVKALIQGATARGHNLKIGGSLYSDAMGIPGSGAETYQGMILHNVETITTGLGGIITSSDD